MRRARGQEARTDRDKAGAVGGDEEGGEGAGEGVEATWMGWAGRGGKAERDAPKMSADGLSGDAMGGKQFECDRLSRWLYSRAGFMYYITSMYPSVRVLQVHIH